jgi:hypothetical protein
VRQGRDAPNALEALDAADVATFEANLSPLFEGAPRFLARLAAARPFGSWLALFDAARSIAHGMPEREQLELVDAHPPLGAPPASVSALSFREQGYAAEGATNLASEAARETVSRPSWTASTARTRPTSGSATVSSWPADRAPSSCPGWRPRSRPSAKTSSDGPSTP